MCSVGLGVLTEEIPPEFVDEVVELSGCGEKRHRLLPARAVVYFVLGLCLFSGADSAAPPGYRSVMRWLTNGLRHLHGLALPTSSALTKARQRLGSKPLELLFDLRRGPLAGPGTKGAFAFGLRLVAWDGTGLDAADTPENAAEFGVTQGGNPQVRLLALIECGTHALIDAAFDGVAKASEHKLARRLLHALNAGMLLLADRNFAGHELWGMVTATGSDMLWRIKKNLVFPAVEILPDGSFLSIMPTPGGEPAARHRPSTRPQPWTGHRTATSSGSSNTPSRSRQRTAARGPNRSGSSPPFSITNKRPQPRSQPSITSAGRSRTGTANSRPDSAERRSSCAPSFPNSSAKNCSRCSPSTKRCAR